MLSQITLMANLFRVIARAFGSKLEASGQVRDAEASGQVDPEDADMREKSHHHRHHRHHRLRGGQKKETKAQSRATVH